jgi:hypothetical protein
MDSLVSEFMKIRLPMAEVDSVQFGGKAVVLIANDEIRDGKLRV